MEASNRSTESEAGAVGTTCESALDDRASVAMTRAALCRMQTPVTRGAQRIALELRAQCPRANQFFRYTVVSWRTNGIQPYLAAPARSKRLLGSGPTLAAFQEAIEAPIAGAPPDSSDGITSNRELEECDPRGLHLVPNQLRPRSVARVKVASDYIGDEVDMPRGRTAKTDQELRR